MVVDLNKSENLWLHEGNRSCGLNNSQKREVDECMQVTPGTCQHQLNFYDYKSHIGASGNAATTAAAAASTLHYPKHAAVGKGSSQRMAQFASVLGALQY